MRKIMISVAPVAATDILINPKAIAKDVIECYKRGASMVHLHVRDLNGKLTADMSLLEETIAYIREGCDIVIEISTGGVSNLTIEERCQPCYSPYVEATSLNVGSVNLGDAVYQNPIKDVRYCVQKIMENNKIPEIEVFELGMINTVRELDDQFHFIRPVLFALVFGHGGEMPATVPALKHMIDGVYENFPNRSDVLWGYTQAHRQDWEMVKVALDMGAASVRIGFEDSNLIAPGVKVDNNAVLISEAADIIKSKGMMPMTPDEVRAMLKIPPLNEKTRAGGRQTWLYKE
ncbi:BKACE family enzyme [Anaeromicropila populeti]|uniref:3-keto-5-aminohexanoate cleavage enzyme n=1 Tax=Anaeromicropila populeti TaxID=37658 RepID=A0A1I6K8K0_9FIRM|nr:3-keto-5-aminohexanoate cleavage protein [Anaeromicropila populeti]SFR87527.1 3-keto-5-aminohexanoate cleavage enzyme [Anaeromicropila populeti]